MFSVHRASPFRDAEENWQDMIRYQHFFIDEEPRVSDSDLFPLLNSISFVSQSYGQTWPRISFISYTYHLPPNTSTQRPPCYYYTKKRSFLELMTPLFPSYLQGLNKIPTMQLNMQYRTFPDIAYMANALSLRNLYTSILSPYIINISYLKRIERAPPII